MESVLIVEDEVQIRTLMSRWVKASGFRVVIASNATQALEEMSGQAAAVAVCDIHIPGRDGLWLTGELREHFPETAVIIATGAAEFSAAVSSLRKGAIDYLLKPFTQDQLWDAIKRGIEWHRNAVSSRMRRQTLEAELKSRNAQVTDAVARARVNTTATLDAMLALLTAHDPGAFEHARRVARSSVVTALLLGVAEPLLSEIERGALLHDIGKVAIPEGLLRTPLPLSEVERSIFVRHPQLGYDIVKNVPFLEGAAGIILASCERFDGQGHPNGLEGLQIPLGARIIAVADEFDAMTEGELPAERLSDYDAIGELLRYRGSRFDPRVLDAFQIAATLRQVGTLPPAGVERPDPNKVAPATLD